MSAAGKARRVGGGKLWGNQLTGGYKTQLRAANGRFATKQQANVIDQQRKMMARARARGVKNIRTHNAKRSDFSYATRSAVVMANRKLGIKNPIKAGATLAGIGSVAAIIGTMNPNVSVSRKHVSLGVSPGMKFFGFRAFTSHSVGIERTGDDFIDRGIRSTQNKLSSGVRSVLADGSGKSTTADVFDAVVLGKKNADGYAKIGGKTVYVDGSLANRRVRWGSGNSTATFKKTGVPGAPKPKGSSKAKPQGGRKGAAKTVTNTTKGSPAVKGRPQRRNSKKKKKGQNGAVISR